MTAYKSGRRGAEVVVSHACHARGCAVEVPPRLLMCGKHWGMVPQPLRDAVWRTYREGQEVRKDPSGAYLVAANAAIEAVAQRERYRRSPEKDMRAHVQHRDDKGAWCGPVIPSGDHPRGDELGDVPVICICCGDFCEGVPADVVALVERLHAKMLREEDLERKRDVELEKLRLAGVDISTLPAGAKRARRSRPEQLDLLARKAST